MALVVESQRNLHCCKDCCETGLVYSKGNDNRCVIYMLTGI